MPVLIIIGLGIVLFVWVNWGRANAKAELGRNLDPIWSRMTARKACRWVASKPGSTGLQEFQCETCKVTAYSTNARGPRECKKGLGGGL